MVMAAMAMLDGHWIYHVAVKHRGPIATCLLGLNRMKTPGFFHHRFDGDTHSICWVNQLDR